MKINQTNVIGGYVIDQTAIEDERGFFSRAYCEKLFADWGLNCRWVQFNNSYSRKRGTLRGLHMQSAPHDEVKLVRCIRGSIWDVSIDLRQESPTYKQWFGAELSAENRRAMYIPRGCAHGFITLEDDSELFYFSSEFYSPKAENTILWNDNELSINWPLTPVVISEKDMDGQRLSSTVSSKSGAGK